MFNAHFTWAPLHAAAYYGSSKIIDELVQAGGNIEIEDTWYKGRPLAWAAFGAHPKICRVIIQEHGAQIDAKNVHGQIASELVPDLSVPSWKGVFAVSLLLQIFFKKLSCYWQIIFISLCLNDLSRISNFYRSGDLHLLQNQKPQL